MADIKPVQIDAHSKVGDVLRAIDDALSADADRLSVHWGFYSTPYPRPPDDPDSLAARHARLWPANTCLVVRSGDNEGWVVEIRSRGSDDALPIGMSKVIGSREDAFEYARLVSVAIGMW